MLLTDNQILFCFWLHFACITGNCHCQRACMHAHNEQEGSHTYIQCDKLLVEWQASVSVAKTRQNAVTDTENMRHTTRCALFPSLDSWPPKSPETTPVCQPPRWPVPVTAAVCDLIVEVELSTFLLKVCCSTNRPKNKTHHITRRRCYLKPVWIVATPCRSCLLQVWRMDRKVLGRFQSNNNAMGAEAHRSCWSHNNSTNATNSTNSWLWHYLTAE